MPLDWHIDHILQPLYTCRALFSRCIESGFLFYFQFLRIAKCLYLLHDVILIPFPFTFIGT